jgi:UDP-N-acetyl-D-glucosamine dehydrogenase
MTKTELLAKIQNRTAVIAIVGLGYVGLPLAVAFAESGFRVVGIDVDEHKVEALRGGKSYVQDIASERLAPLVTPNDKPDLWGSDVARPDSKTGRLFATTAYKALAECDAAIIAVPTPLNKTRDPDVRFLIAAGESVAEQMHPGMLISLESTTYPGTTEELLLPMLEAGFTRDAGPAADPASEAHPRVGQDFFLAFSPERIDPGREDWTVENTPKVVGGVTPACLQAAVALYSQAIKTVIPVSSTQTAEMVKLLENTFRAVNIALVNETAIMCDKLGIDVWEVIEAAATKPYGFMKFTPGPGVGGHCIPLDPYYLSWKLKTLNYNARFVQLAGEINSDMPRYWVEKVQDALNEAGKALKGSRVLVLGVAYKKDIDDLRESPALDIIELLRLKGADVHYHDPHVPQLFHSGEQMRCEPDLMQAVRLADCIVVVTDHSSYDWAAVSHQARAVVDTRHATQGVR